MFLQPATSPAIRVTKGTSRYNGVKQVQPRSSPSSFSTHSTSRHPPPSVSRVLGRVLRSPAIQKNFSLPLHTLQPTRRPIAPPMPHHQQEEGVSPVLLSCGRWPRRRTTPVASEQPPGTSPWKQSDTSEAQAGEPLFPSPLRRTKPLVHEPHHGMPSIESIRYGEFQPPTPLPKNFFTNEATNSRAASRHVPIESIRYGEFPSPARSLPMILFLRTKPI